MKSDEDADRTEKRGKPRPRGTLPYLPDGADVGQLRDWLTRAFRPRYGRVEHFERFGQAPDQPATLTVANGRERRSYRFARQGDLITRLRVTVAAVAGKEMSMPHLTAAEAEDVWVALCAIAQALTEEDEPEQAGEWLRELLDVALPLEGFSLVPDARHDALMALRRKNHFTRLYAIEAARRPDPKDWPVHPTRLIDKHTGEHWLRAGEAVTFLRYILGVEPLKHATLQARWHEIGCERRYFEDRRPPHPKAHLYRVPEGFLAS